MASVIPKEVKKEIADGWVAETWKVCLLTNAFSYVSGTHILYSDLTNEVVGAGYVAGGATVSGKASGYVDTTNVYLYATNTAWAASTLTNVRYAVLYNATSGKIRDIKDLGADYTTSNGTLTIQWHSGGVVKIS